MYFCFFLLMLTGADHLVFSRRSLLLFFGTNSLTKWLVPNQFLLVPGLGLAKCSALCLIIFSWVSYPNKSSWQLNVKTHPLDPLLGQIWLLWSLWSESPATCLLYRRECLSHWCVRIIYLHLQPYVTYSGCPRSGLLIIGHSICYGDMTKLVNY